MDGNEMLQWVSPLVFGVAVVAQYYIGRFVGRNDERIRECDRRLAFAESAEYHALSEIERRGAHVMWGWLQQAEGKKEGA